MLLFTEMHWNYLTSNLQGDHGLRDAIRDASMG